jgi:hypothetical protein
MGININIAIQLGNIAPLLKNCKSGVMWGRQAMHFSPPDWKPRLILFEADRSSLHSTETGGRNIAINDWLPSPEL